MKVQVGGPVSSEPTWYRCGGDNAMLERLQPELGLHPLAVEDAQNARQRPKVEPYKDHLFVVIRVPRPGQEPEWQHVSVFVSQNYVVTASASPVPELNSVQEKVQDTDITPGRLLHKILDACVDSWFPYLDGLEDRVEELGDAVLDKADEDGRRAIRELKDELARTRKVSGPMREAMISLERMDHALLLPSDKPFMRDLSDHMVRLQERLDHVRETALTAQETWMATLAQSQNRNMQRLTVLFALFLIPGLFSGLGGMNFAGIPGWDYWAVTWSILGFVIVGAAVARVKGWL